MDPGALDHNRADHDCLVSRLRSARGPFECLIKNKMSPENRSGKNEIARKSSRARIHSARCASAFFASVPPDRGQKSVFANAFPEPDYNSAPSDENSTLG